MAQYQYHYSKSRPLMFHKESRVKKALRMVKTLDNYFGTNKLNKLTVLDIGSSTGIIDNILAKHFKSVIGTDIDVEAIEFAKKNFKKGNLKFKVENAMKLSFADNTFDVVICAQVYEHVPSPKKLFSEINRVLKPNGICYLAALNKYWPMEPHYHLPFLAWLPKPIAHAYIRLSGKANNYFETPLSYWGLKKITGQFKRQDLTGQILISPGKYGYEDAIPPGSLMNWLTIIFSPLAKYLAPTYFWLLVKKG